MSPRTENDRTLEAGRSRVGSRFASWLGPLVGLLALLPAGCGRSSLLGFDNGCPKDDPNCAQHDGATTGDGPTDDMLFDEDGFLTDGFGQDDGGPGDGFVTDDGGPDAGPGDGGPADFALDGPPGDGGPDGGPKGDGGPDLVLCGPKEICGNHIDDDCNGVADCVDRACQNEPSCIDRKKELCNNGIDDDGNGLVDCKDPQCYGDPACAIPGKEICNNGIDDNDNGLVDCADPECVNDPVCQPPMGKEICDNGKDDNNDGLVDCADPQCVSFPACLQSDCQPEIDFGTIQAHDSYVSKKVNTVGATQTYNTCAAPGGTARVGQFKLAAQADLKLDFWQDNMTVAHVVSVYRAGVGQACDQNLVYCLKAGQMAYSTHTFPSLAAGNYWIIVQSYPGTQGGSTVILSTSSSKTPEICNNGKDDDGNGLVDCADLACVKDPYCKDQECVPDENLGALVAGGAGKIATFDTRLSTNRYHPLCAGASTGNDFAIRYTLKETAFIDVVWSQTADGGVMPDHVIGIFQMPPPGQACDATELSCFPTNAAPNGWVAFVQPRPPGEYLLIFKPTKAGLEGKMKITVTANKPRAGENCNNGVDDNGNGLVDCADPECFGVGLCKAPLCTPDVDLGDFDYGTQKMADVDTRTAKDIYQTKCGKGNGKERVIRINLLKPMALGVSCTEVTGDNVLQLDAQLNPLDMCDANLLVCADPKILPFGCNFSIPNLQAGKYNVIVEAYQQGTEGEMLLTLTGIQQRVLEICDNGIDDDMDGYTDCADKKCVTQPECLKYACRADDRLGTIPLDGTLVDTAVTTKGAGDDQTMTPCVSGAGGQDAVVDFSLPAKADLTIGWAQVGNHDFALYQDSNDLLACEANPIVDCHATMGVVADTYTVTKLPIGKYHLVVDADKAGKEGGVVLEFSAKPSM